MDVHLYLEVRDLFRSKWDPAILEVLAERPYRFLELARRARVIVDDAMEQGAVNRALARLQEAGYIHTASAHDGARDVVVYELTDEGHKTLLAYRVILAAFAQTRSSAPGCAQAGPSDGQPPGHLNGDGGVASDRSRSAGAYAEAPGEPGEE